MKETVDLYAKLVIGTFSFIGPSFTLLIPLFYAAIEKFREKHESQIKNLQKIIQDSMLKEGNFVQQIEVGSKFLKAKVKANKKELNLLDPKRQIRRLFRSLFGAILLIIFYYFQKSHFWPYNYQAIRVTSIALSILSFLYCLHVLWQIFCTIIKAKSEEEKAKPSRNISLKQKKL